jgi:hypothetical protein
LRSAVVVAMAAVAVACAEAVALAAVGCAAAVAADSEAGASRAEASGAAGFEVVDFEVALTAALDSAADSGLPPSMDFTAAMDTTIRSSTILIHLRILIPMDTRMIPMDTHMPGTVQAPQA